jgi:rhodanese-related sulfurtransferase/DNA-binding transcriptional ArsR family regulator
MKHPTRIWRRGVYDQLARIGRSLASGPRLEILDLLCQGPRTVNSIAVEVGQSIANTSHHLQALRRARLVEAEKDGTHVRYRVADEQVARFFRSLRELAESRLLEIRAVTREFLEARGALEPVDLEALIGRIRRGEVTILDVRPGPEYEAGHIPGALSVPLPELKRKLPALPRAREIVAYCRGPYCVLAVEAVDILRHKGFKAVRFDEGVPDWRARGFPVEVGAAERPRRTRGVAGKRRT